MKRLGFFSFILALIISLSSCSGGNKNTQHNQQVSGASQNKQSVEQQPSQATTSDQGTKSLIDEDLYSFPDLNFAVWFPQEPIRQLDTVRDAGYLVMFHTVISKAPNKAYMVAVAEYPTEAIKDVPSDELLKNVMNGFANSMGMNIQSTKLDKFKGKPGLFYTGEANGNFYYIQNVIDGRKVYQIALLSAGNQASKSDLDKYFDSFRFLNSAASN